MSIHDVEEERLPRVEQAVPEEGDGDGEGARSTSEAVRGFLLQTEHHLTRRERERERETYREISERDKGCEGCSGY